MKPWSLALALAVSVHLVLALGMAVSPALHERIHGDAEHHDHECVVKLLVQGGCDTAAAAEPVPAVLPLACEPAPAVVWADVPAVFLTGGVLEHAPPQRG